MKTLSLSLLVLSTLALTGCVDRATADEKLSKACQAGILAFSDEKDSVKKIVKKTITDHATLGRGYRAVKLTLNLTDGFHEREESHSCVFFEEFAFANMSHRASIYNLNFFGKIIGQKNYTIQGSLADMTKLTDAVDAALR